MKSGYLFDNLRLPTEKVTQKIILWLLLALFLMLAFHSHRRNVSCEEVDQDSYIHNALWIKEHGGVVNFPNLCLTGEYDEANQHPLYILLAATFAKREIGYFIKLKILSTVIAFIFFIVFFIVIQKEFGFTTSVIGLSLLITANIFIKYYSWVACEYLLITFTLLTWHFTTKGFTDNRYWFWGGFFNGLAYMSKASALLYLPIFVLTSLIIGFKNNKLKDIFKNKYFGLYFLAFAMVSSLLLIRNVILYDNPFFNYSVKTMWLDDWGQHLSPDIVEESGMVTYVKTHSPVELMQRFVYGVKKQFPVFMRSFRGFIYFRDVPYFWYIYSGIYYLLVILSVVFIFADTDPNRKIYNLVLIGAFYSSLSFFAVIGMAERYFMPITSIMIIYSGIGLNNLLVRFADSIRKYYPRNVTYVSIAVFLSLACFDAFAVVDFDGKLSGMYIAPGNIKLSSWIRGNLKESDVILETPYLEGGMLVELRFVPPVKMVKYSLPPLEDYEQLLDLMEERNVTHFIMNKSGFFRRSQLLGNYFKVTQKEGLQIQKPPPGLELIYSDPRVPVDFLVFKVIQ